MLSTRGEIVKTHDGHQPSVRSHGPTLPPLLRPVVTDRRNGGSEGVIDRPSGRAVRRDQDSPCCLAMSVGILAMSGRPFSAGSYVMHATGLRMWAMLPPDGREPSQTTRSTKTGDPLGPMLPHDEARELPSRFGVSVHPKPTPGGSHPADNLRKHYTW